MEAATELVKNTAQTAVEVASEMPKWTNPVLEAAGDILNSTKAVSIEAPNWLPNPEGIQQSIANLVDKKSGTFFHVESGPSFEGPDGSYTNVSWQTPAEKGSFTAGLLSIFNSPEGKGQASALSWNSEIQDNLYRRGGSINTVNRSAESKPDFIGKESTSLSQEEINTVLAQLKEAKIDSTATENTANIMSADNGLQELIREFATSDEAEFRAESQEKTEGNKKKREIKIFLTTGSPMRIEEDEEEKKRKRKPTEELEEITEEEKPSETSTETTSIQESSSSES